MIPLIPVNKRKMSMSENKTTSGTSDHHETDVELENMNDLPEPQEKKNRWKPLLIWIVPLVALLIALSLAVKALLSNGPTIEVSFRTAEGLVAGKTTVRYKQVDIGVVRQIALAEDRSRVIARIDLRKDASNFAAQDSRFWVVRPRIGTSGVSGIDTLLSGSYIEVDGGKSPEKKLEFTGLEIPPVITSDVPGKVFFLKADDLGSLDIGSPIYYRRINVGQITAYNLADDGKSVELQTFIRAPYDKFVTTDARFWQASGIDVTLNASGFNLDTQSLASIVAGGIAFGFPENSNATVAANKSHFNLWDSKAEALKEPDGQPRGVIMYFDHSLRGLAVGAPIDFMGIEIGSVKSINAEFYNNYKQIRTATELSGLQAQVSQIADKLTKFPLVEIGQDVRKTLKNMNTAIESTDKLVKQLDGKVAPGLQATLDDVRKTVRSSESILSSDAPLQQDVRKALQQMTRAAASLQLMSDYIEQHPESIIRGKRPEANDEK